MPLHPSTRRRAAQLLALAGLAFGIGAAADAATPAAASAAASRPAAANPVVRLSTSAGDILVQLDAEHAPKTVQNFITYVKAGQYTGTVFHRVIEGFMIQGGGFTPALAQKPVRAPIKLETAAGLSNLRGTIAMARTGVPDSATAQFFINVVDNTRLDPAPGNDGYAVFGHVVEGMDVVDKIRVVATSTQNGMANVPVTPVLIKKASLEPTP